jgi:hypothetical protein
MMYILVCLGEVDEERARAFLDAQHTRGLQVVYQDYAPRAWVVSYKGTSRQLADLIWPDGVDEEEYAISDGFVVRAREPDVNGYANLELWNLIAQKASS